jgi:iron complex transport system ATP-binding protein
MILSVQGISFDYPGISVLNKVSFSLKRGETVAVLGTNGAGKSTLLKCINGILKLKVGKIEFDKEDISKIKHNKLAQRLGYVSQQNQYTRTTVFDSVLIGRKPYIKWDVEEKDIQIVDKVLKMMDLDKYALRYTDELSGGEYQKVVIARALAQEPDVLMFDEPTNNLDLKNQLEVVNIIKNIVKKNNISAVVTIHDLKMALRFADRFILLKDGSIFDAGGIEVINSKNIKEVYSVDVSIERLKNNVIVVPM